MKLDGLSMCPACLYLGFQTILSKPMSTDRPANPSFQGGGTL